MEKLFLTSWIGGYDREDESKTPTKLNNANYFVDRLKDACQDIKIVTYFASNPDDFEKSEEHSERLKDNLILEGFNVDKVYVVDNRCNFSIADAIKISDMLFLAGGHVPTQNKFFNKIGLKNLLKNYKGVVVGQSAGSMNCAEIVYVQPEEPEDFDDKNFAIQIEGLGLTKINIMPHINCAKDNVYDGISVYEMCLRDSYAIPHYGIVDGGFIEIDKAKAVSYGETYLFKDGKCVKLCSNGENIIVNDMYELRV